MGYLNSFWEPNKEGFCYLIVPIRSNQDGPLVSDPAYRRNSNPAQPSKAGSALIFSYSSRLGVARVDSNTGPTDAESSPAVVALEPS